MHELLNIIPQSQIEDILFDSHASFEIDGEFLWFTDIYKALSQIIPKDWTVIDFWCAYNPQCFYFLDQKEYIAVDIGNHKRFMSDNCKFYNKRIQDYIAEDLSCNLNKTFAICNYVPDSEAQKMIRKTFPNCYIYYPA